jgi:hypothetical protein
MVCNSVKVIQINGNLLEYPAVIFARDRKSNEDFTTLDIVAVTLYMLYGELKASQCLTSIYAIRKSKEKNKPIGEVLDDVDEHIDILESSIKERIKTLASAMSTPEVMKGFTALRLQIDEYLELNYNTVEERHGDLSRIPAAVLRIIQGMDTVTDSLEVIYLSIMMLVLGVRLNIIINKETHERVWPHIRTCVKVTYVKNGTKCDCVSDSVEGLREDIDQTTFLPLYAESMEKAKEAVMNTLYNSRFTNDQMDGMWNVGEEIIKYLEITHNVEEIDDIIWRTEFRKIKYTYNKKQKSCEEIASKLTNMCRKYIEIPIDIMRKSIMDNNISVDTLRTIEEELKNLSLNEDELSQISSDHLKYLQALFCSICINAAACIAHTDGVQLIMPWGKPIMRPAISLLQRLNDVIKDGTVPVQVMDFIAHCIGGKKELNYDAPYENRAVGLWTGSYTLMLHGMLKPTCDKNDIMKIVIIDGEIVSVAKNEYGEIVADTAVICRNLFGEEPCGQYDNHSVNTSPDRTITCALRPSYGNDKYKVCLELRCEGKLVSRMNPMNVLKGVINLEPSSECKCHPPLVKEVISYEYNPSMYTSNKMPKQENKCYIISVCGNDTMGCIFAGIAEDYKTKVVRDCSKCEKIEVDNEAPLILIAQ